MDFASTQRQLSFNEFSQDGQGGLVGGFDYVPNVPRGSLSTEPAQDHETTANSPAGSPCKEPLLKKRRSVDDDHVVDASSQHSTYVQPTQNMQDDVRAPPSTPAEQPLPAAEPLQPLPATSPQQLSPAVPSKHADLQASPPSMQTPAVQQPVTEAAEPPAQPTEASRLQQPEQVQQPKQQQQTPMTVPSQQRPQEGPASSHEQFVPPTHLQASSQQHQQVKADHEKHTPTPLPAVQQPPQEGPSSKQDQFVPPTHAQTSSLQQEQIKADQEKQTPTPVPAVQQRPQEGPASKQDQFVPPTQPSRPTQQQATAEQANKPAAPTTIQKQSMEPLQQQACTPSPAAAQQKAPTNMAITPYASSHAAAPPSAAAIDRRIRRVMQANACGKHRVSEQIRKMWDNLETRPKVFQLFGECQHDPDHGPHNNMIDKYTCFKG